MASKIKVDELETTSGSGSIAINNTFSSFTSTGIDDNATSTAITIDSNENVGIGVVPESDLTTSQKTLRLGYATSLVGWGSSANTYLYNNVNRTSSGQKYLTTDEACLYQMSNEGTHSFYVAPSGTADSAISWTTAMKIDNSGNVLVGKTSSSYTVAGIGLRGTVADFTRAGGNPININRLSSNGSAVIFHKDGVNVGNITVSASATSYVTSSDYRLKENVVPMTGSIDRLKALNPSRFNFIADVDTTVDGFLAHEAQVIVPECVTGEKDAMMTEEYEVTPAVMDGEDVVTEAVMGEREVEDYQGIDQSKLVPLLVASLQEAIARIEILEGGN